MRPHGVFVVHRDSAAVTFQTEDSALAHLSVALGRAICRVVVEERIQSCTIYRDTIRVDYSKAVTICRWNSQVSVLYGGLWELWIEVSCGIWEWQRCSWIRLVVSCLSLDLWPPLLAQHLVRSSLFHLLDQRTHL